MDEEDVPESGDGLFGYNLRRLRERDRMSQAALTAAMRDRNWPWHQSTVYRIESGKQPATFWEARDLAAIFGVVLERFTWKPGDANAIDWLDMATRRLQGRYAETKNAVTAQRSAVGLAGRALEDTAGHTAPRVLEARQILEKAIKHYGNVDAAVEEGRQAYQGAGVDDEGSGDGDGDAVAAEAPETSRRSA